jgi:hypothetical protein
LFLVVLTLGVSGSAVNRSVAWRTVKLVTAFTIGHGVSLALSYFNVISVPASVVEPAIALSIVVAALLAMRRVPSESRPVIAAIVGVIHGLGFASSIDSLGVATAHRVWALAAFNSGIDVAQTIVVLVVLAVLWVAIKAFADRAVWIRLPTAGVAATSGLF